MHNKILKTAKSLYNSGQYLECYNYINEIIGNGTHRLPYYVIRSRCLIKLGRVGEAHDFSWSMINFKNPEQDDLEAIEVIKASLEHNDWMLEYWRFCHIYDCITGKCDADITNQEEKKLLESFFNSKEPDEGLALKIAEYYYIANDLVKSAFYHVIYMKLSDSFEKRLESNIGINLSHFYNINDVYMMLENMETSSIAFVLKDSVSSNDSYGYIKMAEACRFIGKKPILITPPIEHDVNENDVLDMQYYIDLSLNNCEIVNDVPFYVPINFYMNNAFKDSTTLPLLDYLSLLTPNKNLPVIAEHDTLDYMRSKHTSRKIIHYVFNDFACANSHSATCLGYINGYDYYSSMLYKINVINEIKEDSKHAYSIVVPVRNNARTLKYTLMTCLQQDFKDYEIVISDNSDNDNTQIYNMLKKEFDSEHIKYYRTPRILPITKSFEYAYIKSKGDFIIPIGADDGLLFNALESLDSVLKDLQKSNDVNIVSWERIHYVWNEFTQSGQSGQFIIPRSYMKNKFNIVKIKAVDILCGLLNFKFPMYGLPLLYINSGMKRSYLLKMLEKTGAMIDGHSQDLYTGIANLAINDECIYIQYPFTIAALSSNSSGAQSLFGCTDEKISQSRGEESLKTNIGMHMQRNLEDRFIASDGDVANMVTQVLRLIDMECLDINTLNMFDWKAIVNNIYRQIQPDDIYCEKFRKELLNSVRPFSEDAYSYLYELLKLEEFTVNKRINNMGKRYYKGFSENGALNLDASEFGVTNIYEACELFRKICNL